MEYGKAIQAVISADHKEGVHTNAYRFMKVCTQCRGKIRDDNPGLAEWETCIKCGDEFRYGHICREHGICGVCHPPAPRKTPYTVEGV